MKALVYHGNNSVEAVTANSKIRNGDKQKQADNSK